MAEPSAPATTTQEPVFLTVKEAASRLRLSVWTVYSLLDSGALAGVYQGSRRYTTPQALDDYVASLSSTPPARSGE